jgi:hypothetical protein
MLDTADPYLPTHVSVRTAAALLGRSAKSVRGFCRSGTIVAEQTPGGRFSIPLDNVGLLLGRAVSVQDLRHADAKRAPFLAYHRTYNSTRAKTAEDHLAPSGGSANTTTPNGLDPQ